LALPPQPIIVNVSITDSAVMIERADGSAQVYQGDESAVSSRQIAFQPASASTWSLYPDRSAKLPIRARKEASRGASTSVPAEDAQDDAMEVDYSEGDALYAEGGKKDAGLPAFKGYADASKHFAVSATSDGKFEVCRAEQCGRTNC
jgi:hypothetical protein